MTWSLETFWTRDILYNLVGLHHYLPMIEEAKCAGTDPEIFFPKQPVTEKKTQAAVEICKMCPVTTECLEFALRNDIRYGIWGGTSAQQRRALRRL